MSTWTKRATLGATAAVSVVLALSFGCGRTQDPSAQDVGDPPAEAQPAETTPEPWEYDAERDRHWHPGHGHWHQGPPPEGAEAPPADAEEGAEEADLRWHTSLSDALEAAQDRQSLVLVDAYAEWCGWCKKLEEETLSHPDVQERLKDFTLMKLDTDEQGQVAQRLGVTGVPTILVLDSEGDVLLQRTGFVPPEAFLEFLDQLGQQAT